MSSIAIDQGHEQNNAVMKDDGGIFGITQDSAALTRWCLTSPETVRVTEKFESSMRVNCEQHSEKTHHQETKSHQTRFLAHVKSLTETIDTLGNPFEEFTRDLVRLHNREVMDTESIECLSQIQDIGEQQYNLFIEERLQSVKKPISDPIHRNKIVLFNKIPSKKDIKSRTSIESS